MDDYQAYALAVRLGGEEGGEEVAGGLLGDGGSVVGHAPVAGAGGDGDAGVGRTVREGLHRVLDDVGQHLLHQHLVYRHFSGLLIYLGYERYLFLAPEALQKWQHAAQEGAGVHRPAYRVGNPGHRGVVGDEAAHPVYPREQYRQHRGGVPVPRVSGGLLYGVEGRGDAGHGVVDLVGDDADDLLVAPLFGLVQLLGQGLDHVERVGEAPVHEGREGTAVDVQGVGLEDAALVRLQSGEQSEQGQGAVLQELSAVRLNAPDSEHPVQCRVGRVDAVTDVHDQHPGRGGGDELVEEVVLLLNPQLLVVQAVAHAVEQLYDAVGVLLPHGSQAGGEVLLLDQVDASGEGVQRLYGLLVQYHKEDNGSYQQHLRRDVYPVARPLVRHHEGKSYGGRHHHDEQHRYEPEVSS